MEAELIFQSQREVNGVCEGAITGYYQMDAVIKMSESCPEINNFDNGAGVQQAMENRDIYLEQTELICGVSWSPGEHKQIFDW